MKRFRMFCWMILAVSSANLASAVPLGPGFTYQGKLEQNGTPVNGPTHLRFRLFDALAGGNQIGLQQILASVPVTDGLFTVLLNGNGEFGPNAFNGDARWLQIEVCGDPGCANATTLSPRQAITATPYALKVPGVDGYSLDAADGSPTDAVVVDNVGNVGIGTTPNTQLEVKSGFGTEVMRFGLDSEDYHSISTGFHGGLPFLNYLGFNLEYVHSDTRRVMTLQGDGNVGIGTPTPTQKLQVLGNIALGPSGQYFAPAAEENLRLMRGTVESDGVPSAGCCFSVSKCGAGCYDITYNTAFTGVPSVTVTPRCAGYTVGLVGFGPGSTPTASSIRVITLYSDSSQDCDFYFVAIGPR